MDQTLKDVRVLFLLQMTSRCLALKITITHTCMKQWGESEVQELNWILRNVIKSKSCTIFGNVYSPHGVKTGPQESWGHHKDRSTTDKQELQSFLGRVNYLGQFIKNMAELTANLRLLFRKDVFFSGQRDMKPTSKKLKGSISTDACLMYFNSSKPVILQADASKLGLGDVSYMKTTMESWGPVAYVSKSLTPAETRYANVEREMLAVVWGCIKFHHYLHGRKFLLSVRPQTLGRYTYENTSLMHLPGYRDYCWNCNHMIFL